MAHAEAPGDHPRACGEHSAKVARSKFGRGSSPRMRGTPHRREPPKSLQRDHPRACGEHQGRSAGRLHREGSSPRMRGTRSYGDTGARTPGIIPAHAGNTAGCRPMSVAPWDHPRACGEHFAKYGLAFWTAGSSPRMRGTRIYRALASHNGGIIPAHAGNTTLRTSIALKRRDHPRACGEHRYSCSLVLRAKGSSPRMRGTRLLLDGEIVHEGIIPAHAGNTSPMARPPASAEDHPRACGEHA